VSENRVLLRISALKIDEIIGYLRKLQSDLYSQRGCEGQGMQQARGEEQCIQGFSGKPGEMKRVQWKELDVGDRIILR
jgi:hypothetical protein